MTDTHPPLCAMAARRMDLASLLSSLEPFLERFSVGTGKVRVEVAPLRGRQSVRFQRCLAPLEDHLVQIVETLMEAAHWLNQQPGVFRKIRTDVQRPAVELEGALRNLVSAITAELGPFPPSSESELGLAIQASETALDDWGGR